MQFFTKESMGRAGGMNISHLDDFDFMLCQESIARTFSDFMKRGDVFVWNYDDEDFNDHVILDILMRLGWIIDYWDHIGNDWLRHYILSPLYAKDNVLVRNQ